ncbi:hypothetical protein O181_067106 [Austropuccinia psidii MF-1]|uniref:Uncharacterized protein n=1 Tax=Austropuccinia psidii MF-1 TaxID=1389203 RepID=A0A9Q3EYY8_9BASI|nr:hypothetical protein [Austropuccinia psidii MF-1]
MGFKHQKQNPPNTLQKDSPVPCMCRKKTLRQLTACPSGTQCEMTLPPFIEPSQHNEPPIPGPSHSSESQLPSHEDASTCGPEPEVAPTQSTEDPFFKSPLSIFSCYQHSLTAPLTISTLPETPCSIIIINDTPVRTPPPLPLPPGTHPHHEACQEFTDLSPTLMIS